MKLKVDIVYENLYDSARAGVANSDVDAKVEVTAVGGWAGPGAQVFYIQAPTLAPVELAWACTATDSDATVKKTRCDIQ